MNSIRRFKSHIFQFIKDRNKDLMKSKEKKSNWRVYLEDILNFKEEKLTELNMEGKSNAEHGERSNNDSKE